MKIITMKISQKKWSEIVDIGQMVGEGDNAIKYQLDFSIKSVVRLDKMIDDLWEGEIPNNLDNMIYLFGSYLAIITENYFNGSWSINKQTNEINFESKTSKVKFNPWNWVAKKFELNESLSSKTQVIFKMIKDDVK